MTVEITPQGNARRIAQELLAVAEAMPQFTVNDVKTTTSGPLGLAFIVPDELHEAWSAANLRAEEATTETSTEPDATPRRRGGRKASETPKE
jgi:NAD(P)H-nitrite reductase large subunit